MNTKTTDIKIMLIDAHPVYAPKMTGFLESLTFKSIETVPSGIRALEQLGRSRPDLIILSATLPDIDSVALVQQIKSIHPGVPIIVQTGLLTSTQTIHAFTSAGVEYVIPRREKDWSALEEILMAL